LPSNGSTYHNNKEEKRREGYRGLKQGEEIEE
jgi:hypothetical protein